MEKFSLTEVQLAYMLGRNEEFKSGNVATHYYNEILNNLDADRFQRALNKVIQGHKMLHTIINRDATQSELKEYAPYQVKYHDLSVLSEQEREEKRLEIREELSHKNYEIGTWPMFSFEIAKISEEKKVLFVSIDLIISDASSIMILFNDLYRYYMDETLPVQEEEVTFQDFVTYMEDMKTKDRYKQDKQYWMGQMMEIPMGPSLITKKKVEEENSRFKRLTYISKEDTWKKCRNNIMKHGLIQTTYLCECYREVLGYWSGSNDFSINLTTTNRGKLSGTENVIGDFTSLTILPMPKEHTSNIWENAKGLQRKLIEVYSHATFDGIDVEREFRKCHNLQSEIPFPVVFTSLMGGGKEEFDHEFFEATDFSVSQTSQVYLDCQVSEEEDTLIVTWDYQAGRFDETTMSHMFDQFVALIKLAGKEDSSEDIYHILKPSKDDMEKISGYNNSSVNIKAASLSQMLLDSTKQYSSNIAIIDEAKEVTYHEAMEEVKRIATFLRKQGVKKGDRVAVIGNKNATTVEMIWACAYEGIVFVPIHPEYPDERRNYIISDSKAVLTLDTECRECMEQIRNCDGMTEEVQVEADTEAYIIYTSGSTGNPKGVVITNAGVYNTLFDMNQRFHITSEDRIFNLSEFGFDLSIYDLFGSVLAGAAVVINKDVRDVAGIYRNLTEKQVTVWNSVPSIYSLILEYGAKRDTEGIKLKKVFLSGDWISLDTYERSKAVFPDTELISLGGATEASIWSIYYRVNSMEEDWKSIPYGYPLANQQLYVMDGERRMLPVGVPGEIYIGGTGVAKGYTNPELTKKSFFESDTLGRIYKTGDAGVFSVDGYLNILGRIDNQVKINGYRIETQEIEQTIQREEMVENAFVEISQRGKAKRIFAFVCTKEPAALTEDDISYLKEELRKSLPVYMVPYHIEQLEKVPLNSNGKVDRKALKAMADTIELKPVEFKKPEIEIQEALYEAWSDMFSHYEFGVNTDFFDAGGDSLMMIYNLAFIEEKFGVKVRGREFLEHATIEQLALLIEERRQA